MLVESLSKLYNNLKVMVNDSILFLRHYAQQKASFPSILACCMHTEPRAAHQVVFLFNFPTPGVCPFSPLESIIVSCCSRSSFEDNPTKRKIAPSLLRTEHCIDMVALFILAICKFRVGTFFFLIAVYGKAECRGFSSRCMRQQG